MSNDVYYSTILTNSLVNSLLRAFFTYPESMRARENNDPLYMHKLKSFEKASMGVKLTKSELPPNLFYEPGDEVKPLPEVFYANGYIVLRQKAFDVFSRFDLGDTELEPIEIFESDRETKIPGSYYLVNFGCVKETFLPDQSTGLRPPSKAWYGTVWWPPLGAKDGLMAVSQFASEGSHLWHEKSVSHCIFMSGLLRDALAAEKLDKPFQFFKCSVMGA